MSIKIKNWKLAILALIFIGFFTSLGFWQLSRAAEKKSLLQSFDARTKQMPLAAKNLLKDNDLRFYRATLEGSFDNEHTFLLDNKTSHRQIGYEVYTPFKAKGIEMPILVDRGFIPMGMDRAILPAIRVIPGNVTILGMLNLPPKYVSLGQLQDAKQSWPLRVEYVNLAEFASLLNYPLFSYLLTLEPNNPAAFAAEWQIVTMGPEKHLGYAVQWFAMAATLLILFVALNFKVVRSRE